MDDIVPVYRDQLQIEFNIYKDKYWQTLAHFAAPAV